VLLGRLLVLSAFVAWVVVALQKSVS